MFCNWNCKTVCRPGALSSTSGTLPFIRKIMSGSLKPTPFYYVKHVETFKDTIKYQGEPKSLKAFYVVETHPNAEFEGPGRWTLLECNSNMKYEYLHRQWSSWGGLMVGWENAPLKTGWCGHLSNPLLNLNVRGPCYLDLIRSISWLLMPWLPAWPGHQQPWYWLSKWKLPRFPKQLSAHFLEHTFLPHRCGSSSPKNREVLVLHKKGFQVSVSSHCEGMIEIVNTCLCFCLKIRHVNSWYVLCLHARPRQPTIRYLHVTADDKKSLMALNSASVSQAIKCPFSWTHISSASL